MTKRHLFTLGGLLIGLVSGHLHADTTVATVPVGFLSETIAAATTNGPTNGTIAVPLYPSAAFAGLVTSVDSATAFSSADAGWTANQFSATPFFVRLTSGANVGRCFPITANTAMQLTVNAQGATNTQAYDLTKVVSAGDTFEVFAANTLGSLFGTTGGPFLTGKSANLADNVYLWDASAQTWTVYFNNGTHWMRSSSLQSQDNTILYPEEGMYIVHRDTAKALTFGFLGTVPSTTERTDVPGPGSVCIAARFPVNTTLGALAMQNLTGWQSGTTAAKADDVYVWNTTANAWDVCFYNGTNWRKTSSLSNVDATEIVPAGAALFVVRRSAATGTASTFTQPLPYIF